MRIASCNLLHGIDVRTLSRGQTAVGHEAVDLEAVAHWIEGLDADVVALQEVDTGLSRSGGVDQVGWLADRLGYDGAWGAALMGDPDTAWEEVPPDGLPAGAGGYGVGLLSRLGLADVVRTRLPHGGPGQREPGASPTNPGMDREPRVSLSATVQGVRVSTTHLSYVPWRAVPQLGHALRAAAHGHDGPGVVIGDINLPLWGGRMALRTRGLPPWPLSARASRPHGWHHPSGTATYPSWKPRLQLDQVFLRHVRHPVRVTAGPRGPSDHLPLVVDL